MLGTTRNLILSAREEEKRLRELLEATVLFQRHQSVKDFLAKYESLPDATFDMMPHPQLAAPRRSSSKDQVIAAAVEYLRRTGVRATSSTLLIAIEAQGITLKGKKPVNRVSNLLSQSKLFDNDRTAGGYGLREWSEKEEAAA